MELKKIWATGLAGAAIAASLAVPTVTRATTVEQTVVEGLSLSTPLSELSQAPNNDELFNEYVRRLFYGDFDISLLGTSGYDQLNARQKSLYDDIEKAAASIAAGQSTSTAKHEFGPLVYTEQEIEAFAGGSIENDEQYKSAVQNLFRAERATVFDAVQYDNPFEFYWYDKVPGTQIAYTSTIGADRSVTISGTMDFRVAKDYRSDPDNEFSFSVNTSKVTGAISASEKAKEIVAKYAGKSDVDKLKGYKDEICSLAAYNYEAAGDPATPYGDPWQLVWVFDGDESTKVVCEGYAKAFQYLCDLTQFVDGDIRCTTISGQMTGGAGAGGHMWNIVKMDDGRNYLVDVTNSDTGTVGSDGSRFLVPYTSIVRGPENKPLEYAFGNTEYEYDTELYDLYSADYLNISADPYTGPVVVEPVSLEDATVTVGGTYTYNGSAQTPAAEDVAVALDGVAVPQSAYTIEAANNTDAGTATVTVNAVAGKGYTGSATGKFEIAPKALTASIEGTASKTYDGDTTVDGGLSIALDGAVEGDDVTATAAFAYEGANAGEQKTVKASGVKLAGNDAKNYSLDTTELTAQVGTITKATPSGGVTCDAAKLWAGASTSDVKLTWSGTPEGSAVLDDGVLEVGTWDYGWTFTPTDTTNYETLTGTISLTATEDTVQSISVTKQPTKTEYVYGEEFDPAGMAVTATYASGATKDVTGEVAYELRLTAGQDSVELTYGEGGTSVTCTVSVNVLAATGQPTLELRHGVTATYDGTALEPSDLIASALYGDEAATDSDLTFSYMRTGDDGSPVGVPTQGLPCDAGTYYVTAELAPKIVGDVAYGYAFTGVSVTIDPAELTSDLFEAIPDQTYDGAPVEPVVTIADPDSGFLTVDDFTVTYESNAGAGTGYAVVTATEDGNFTGSVKLPFTIAASTPGPTPGGGSSTPSEPTYTPEVPETDRGEVSVTPARPHEGDTVTITPEPDEGNEVRSVTVTDEDGNVIEVTMGEDGTWSFEQPEGEVTIEVVFGCDGGDLCTSHAFPDVDHDMWYHDAIDWAVDAGAFHGYDNGSFGPDDTLAREQAAAVLWNLFGEGDASAPGASMSDVAQGQWYSAAVNWAVANGVMNGYDGTGTFGVGDALTREQFTGMVANACGADLTSVDLSVLEAYGDFEGVSGWAKRAMAWAIEAGVINGVDLPDGTRELQAGRNISRAEMAAMMKNAIDAGVLELG